MAIPTYIPHSPHKSKIYCIIMSMEKTNLQERAEAFIKEYGMLVAKHNMDFSHYPVFVPAGENGLFGVMLQSSPIDITPKTEDVIVPSDVQKN